MNLHMRQKAMSIKRAMSTSPAASPITTYPKVLCQKSESELDEEELLSVAAGRALGAAVGVAAVEY